MYNVLYCTPLFFSPYCDARDLHSFPTRRSSDLAFGEGWVAVGDAAQSYDPLSSQGLRYALESGIRAAFAVDAALDGDHRHRSEEHTSELQSHSDLVCRLLLEKKKISDVYIYCLR